MRRNHVHCQYHCRACGSHFASLGGFEAHRQFDDGHKDDWDHRVCVEPADSDRFEASDRNGVCRLSGMGEHVELSPVTVWTTRRTEAQWQRLRALRASQDRAQNAQDAPKGADPTETTSDPETAEEGASAA